MDYEETVEIEHNVKIKNEAEKICSDFKKNMQLKISNYKGKGQFEIWSDCHNAAFVVVHDDCFELQCRFLHESYNIKVTPSIVFNGIKNKDMVIDHLRSYSQRVA